MRPIWSGAISFGLVSVPVREEEGGEVVDLMNALRESVERTKKQRRGTSKRKAS
jgi:non-homologous end joining protein Ku